MLLLVLKDLFATSGEGFAQFFANALNPKASDHFAVFLSLLDLLYRVALVSQLAGKFVLVDHADTALYRVDKPAADDHRRRAEQAGSRQAD